MSMSLSQNRHRPADMVDRMASNAAIVEQDSPMIMVVISDEQH